MNSGTLVLAVPLSGVVGWPERSLCWQSAIQTDSRARISSQEIRLSNARWLKHKMRSVSLGRLSLAGHRVLVDVDGHLSVISK